MDTFMLILICIWFILWLGLGNLKQKLLTYHTGGMPDLATVKRDLRVCVLTRWGLPFWTLTLIFFIVLLGKDFRLQYITWLVVFWLWCACRTIWDLVRISTDEFLWDTAVVVDKKSIKYTDPDSPTTLHYLVFSQQGRNWKMRVAEYEFNWTKINDTILFVYLGNGINATLLYRVGQEDEGNPSAAADGQYWTCTCGRTHLRNVSSCVCGQNKDSVRFRK